MSILKILKQCDVCKHLFGSHDRYIHIEKIASEIFNAKSELKDLWFLKFNQELLLKELDKWK